MLFRQRKHLTHAHRRWNRDRILDDTALKALDLRNLRGLLLRRHVLVHDTHAAFLGDCDGKACFGYGIHRRRQQRDVQRDALGEARP